MIFAFLYPSFASALSLSVNSKCSQTLYDWKCLYFSLSVLRNGLAEHIIMLGELFFYNTEKCYSVFFCNFLLSRSLLPNYCFFIIFSGTFPFSLCLWCIAVSVYLCVICFHLYFVTWCINKNRKILSFFGGLQKTFLEVFFLLISPFLPRGTFIRSMKNLPILYSDSWLLFNIFYISISIFWILGNFLKSVFQFSSFLFTCLVHNLFFDI